MKKQNSIWLDDFCFRLLYILCLDRFGDFVSDQVIAPVRETSAQVIGAIARSLSFESASKMVDILMKMFLRKEWEVRHSGLLGFKYLVAVRNDLVSNVIKNYLSLIIQGLEDDVDDVRYVAADSLIPIADQIISTVSNNDLQFLQIKLWNILLDLDDLSASTATVMRLLGKFINLI